MPLNLGRSIAGHEVWQLRVQHQVEVAHLIMVGCPGLDWACLIAGVKHAGGFEGISGPYGDVLFQGGEALGHLGVVSA